MANQHELDQCSCGKPGEWRWVLIFPPGSSETIPDDVPRFLDYCNECFERNVPEEKRHGTLHGLPYHWIRHAPNDHEVTHVVEENVVE